VTPHDPLTFVAVAMALMAVALAAPLCAGAARRRLDPGVGLRWE